MYGDERKRFGSECKLNVYNLSGMTRREAEALVFNSEGRLCVRFFRQSDGTVLTANCPVGLARIKQRISRAAAAAASIILGFAGGLLSVRATEALRSFTYFEPVATVPTKSEVMTYVAINYEATVGQLYKVQGKPILPEPTKRVRKPRRK